MLISKQVEFNDPYRVQNILEAVYERHSLNTTCSQVFFPPWIFLSTLLYAFLGALQVPELWKVIQKIFADFAESQNL